MILAGDIGGTKTNLALFEPDGDKLRPVREATFPSREHAAFEEILGQFLGDNRDSGIESSCFGVAGAVLDGRVHTTNLPWTLVEGDLAEAIGCPRATLLNDLEAAAYAMPRQELDQLHVLNAGTSRRHRGNVAVIAAGTGLGEAVLFWNGSGFVPIASEGGHADFAPGPTSRSTCSATSATSSTATSATSESCPARPLQHLYLLSRLRPRPRARTGSPTSSQRGPWRDRLPDGDGGQGRQLHRRPRPLRLPLRRRGRQPRPQGPGDGRRLHRRRDRPQDPPRPRQERRLPPRLLHQRPLHRPDEDLHVSVALNPKAPLMGAGFYASDHRDG